jgi:5-methylcytosine-specific restriction endonuclease McrA
MNAFLRSKRLVTGGGKIQKRIERAFALHGKQRPAGTTIQAWCFENIAFIKEKGADFKSGNAQWVQPSAPSQRPIKSRIDPNSPEFLESYEWRSLRMEVLAKYGPVCMCCGATREDGEKMHVDHIKPRRKRPDLALIFDNLQVLCGTCNHGKGNWDETDWRPVEKPQDDFDSNARAHLRLISQG